MSVRGLLSVLLLGLLVAGCSLANSPALPEVDVPIVTAATSTPASRLAGTPSGTTREYPTANDSPATPSSEPTASSVEPAPSLTAASQCWADSALREAPLPPELAVLVDPLVEQTRQSTDVVGLSLAIRMGSSPIYVKGYGYAEIYSATPADAGTIYEIGSVTKQFTAAAVMQLLEEGALELGDTAGSYLPYLPASWSQVTIHQLLNHTSGIPNYTTLHSQGILDIRFDAEFSTQGLITAIADLDLDLDFPPGSQWRYCNTGYLILGAIAEQVSQETYAEYLEARITGPLGMGSTVFCTVPHPGLAQGYRLVQGEVQPSAFIHPSVRGAAGGICSTAGDLVRWLQALREGCVISPTSYEQMIQPGTLTSGEPVPYGYGLWVSQSSGRDSIWHGGGTSGFKARIIYYPDEDLSLAVLANTVSPLYKPEALTSAIVDSLIPGSR